MRFPAGASNYATCSADETLTYDIWDNRKTRTTASGTVAYLLDAAHQLKETRSGSDTGPILASYAWDDNGNLTAQPGQTLTWTPDNRLAGIGSDSYQYDPQGRRIRKTSGAVTTSWRYNGDDIHAEWNAATPSGAPQAVYVHGGGIDDPIMRLTGDTASPNATASRYHPDGLGSLVAQTTNSGATQGLQRFDAWGNKTQSSGMIDQYGYTGREPDATGLIYYRARYYDPTTGRFISRDPAGMPDGVNRYAYVSNNPVNFTDPSGMVLETAWDVANIGLGVASLTANVRQGNWGWAALDAVGLAYDSVAAAVPFLPAGASAGIKTYRAGNTVVNSAKVGFDVTKVADVANQVARNSNVTGRAAEVGTAIHRQVGTALENGNVLSSSANNFFKGANQATGKQPDLSWNGVSAWADLTTAGQWGKHVATYADDFGVGIPLIYKAGEGLSDAGRLYSGAGTGLTSLQSFASGDLSWLSPYSGGQSTVHIGK